jgi:hypothetical protein
MNDIGKQELIDFTNIKIKDGGKKKVISTNMFIPQVMDITTKHFMYLTGLIKSVETFKEKMGPDWIYRIYYDKMFDTMFVNRENHNSLNKVYTKADNNTSYNNSVKKTFNDNKDIIKKYITIINLYFKKIIANADNKYDFVELISFDCPKLREKKYLGHPDTFGSIMRFFCFFDPNVDLCYCVNSSHSISSYLAKHLKYFAKDDRYAYSNLIGSNKKGYHFTQENIDKFEDMLQTKKELEELLLSSEAKISGKNNSFFGYKDIHQRIETIRNKLKKTKVNAAISYEMVLRHLEAIYIDDQIIKKNKNSKSKENKNINNNIPTQMKIFKDNYALINSNIYLSFDELYSYREYHTTIYLFRRLPAGLIGVKTNASIQSTFVKKKDYIYKKFIEILEILTNDINNFNYGIDEYILSIFILPSITGDKSVDEQDSKLILKGANERAWLENKHDDSTEIKQDLSIESTDISNLKKVRETKDFSVLSLEEYRVLSFLLIQHTHATLTILNNIVYDHRYHRLFSISFVLNVILKLKDLSRKNISEDKPRNDNKLIFCVEDTKDDFIKYLCSFNEIKPLILYNKKLMDVYETKYIKSGYAIKKDIFTNIKSRAEYYNYDSLALSTYLIINTVALLNYFTIIDFSDDSKTTTNLLEEIITYYKTPESYNEIEIVMCSQAGGKHSNKYKKKTKIYTGKIIKNPHNNTKKSKKSKKSK